MVFFGFPRVVFSFLSLWSSKKTSKNGGVLPLGQKTLQRLSVFALSTAEMQLVEGRNPAGIFLQLYFQNM